MENYIEKLKHRFLNAMASGEINDIDPNSYFKWFESEYVEVMVSNFGWAHSHKSLQEQIEVLKSKLAGHERIESILMERAKKHEEANGKA